jgi:hypothetical protein
MNLADKLGYAKRAVENIARHDDEPVAEREKTLSVLSDFVERELNEARGREAARVDERKKFNAAKAKAGR